MDIQKLIGLNVRRHRMAAKISQEELAARMDADQAYISRLEAGHKNPTATTIEQIANALSIEAKMLFEKSK
ncbi:MAG: helix-turn-helix transcriptional regulator [Alphaproteobacteria bacterium]|nr:helix-turn-helix transcriptional regulator [Alphaproteobacteria bacterium]